MFRLKGLNHLYSLCTHLHGEAERLMKYGPSWKASAWRLCSAATRRAIAPRFPVRLPGSVLTWLLAYFCLQSCSLRAKSQRGFESVWEKDERGQNDTGMNENITWQLQFSHQSLCLHVCFSIYTSVKVWSSLVGIFIRVVSLKQSWVNKIGIS